MDSYPYLEYGILTETIENISILANKPMNSDKKVYIATVKMPYKKLKTSYNKIIHFEGELTGNAEIITNNLSIGKRIFLPFKYIFNNNINNSTFY